MTPRIDRGQSQPRRKRPFWDVEMFSFASSADDRSWMSLVSTGGLLKSVFLPFSRHSLQHLRWSLEVLLSSNDVDTCRPHREGTEAAFAVTFSFCALSETER